MRKKIIALVIRLLVTFIEGFSAAWAATGFRSDKLALGGAVAAAISFAYNLVLKPQLEKLNSVQGA